MAQEHSPSTFRLLFITGIASFEPRDYRVVFVIQKEITNRSIAETLSLFVFCDVFYESKPALLFICSDVFAFAVTFVVPNG